ncbi:MAG TPA: hypothetical protein VNR65_14170 [Geobacterales bacterium]|nr:hypothetical protein [Geobacterales bacterium]
MPLENGRQGKDRQNPEKLSPLIDGGESVDMVAASDPGETAPEKAPKASVDPVTPQEAAPAIKEEMMPKSPEELEQINKSYYAEASLTKKITVFAVTTVLILIALGLIYVNVPLGIVK